MNKQYRIRIDVINLIIRFLVFITLTSFILFSITGLDSYVWKSLMLFPAAIISYLIRKYSKNIWSLIILHLVLLVAYVFLADNLILRVAYIINITTYAITEFVLDINKKVKNTPLVLSLIIIALYALYKVFFPEENMLGFFFFSLAILFGLLYIVNMYYVNSYIYFKKHEEKVNIPMKKIQSANTFYIGGFLILSLVVMILFTRIPLGGIGSFFSDIFVSFIKFLISVSLLILRKPEEITLEEEMLDSGGVPIMPEPTLFSDIVTAIFGGITIIVMLLGIIYGLYRVYKLFYSKVVIMDDVRREKITPFIKDSKKVDRKSSTVRRSIRTLFDNSNNIKIRRLFIRAVQKNTQSDHVLKYKLPEELSEYALGSGKANMGDLEIQSKRAELTAIYEKARYSNSECSKEEVRLVKNILSL